MNRIARKILAQFPRHVWALVVCLLIAGAAMITVGVFHYTQVSAEQKADRLPHQNIWAAERADSPKQITRAIKELQHTQQYQMMPATRAKLLVALADLHRKWIDISPDDSDRSYYLDTAKRYYEEAIPLCNDKATRRAIRRGLALVKYQKGAWIDAYQLLSGLMQNNLPPEKRTELEMLRCRCLIHTGRMTEAYDTLDTILSRYTDGTIHNTAQMLMGELLVEALNRRLPALEPRHHIESTFAEPLRFDSETIKRKAREALEDLLEKLENKDIRKMSVLNNLLELCILREDSDSAYQYVRQIETMAGNHTEQIRSYTLLADLEQQQGNIHEAERVLRFCLKRFPEHSQTKNIRFKLYELVRGTGQIDQALGILQTLLDNARDREWILHLTKQFMPKSADSIVAGLSPDTEHQDILQTIRPMLDSLQKKTDQRWLEIHERILYLKAALPYHAGILPEAEDHARNYLAYSPYGDYHKDVTLLYARCAIRQNRSPAIQAARIHRYLFEYPNDPEHSDDFFEVLLRNYYTMGLYKAARKNAESAFVKAMIYNEDTPPETFRLPLLQTLVLLAQSNSRLDNFEIANRLFRRVAFRLDELSPPLDFYTDWAHAAHLAGQRREALRRLEIARDRLPENTPGRDHIRAKSLVLRHQLGFPNATKDISDELEKLHAQPIPPSRQAIAPLYAKLLSEHFSNKLDAVPVTLRSMHEAVPDANFSSYWPLRYLRRLIEADQHEDANKTIEEIRGTTPPHVLVAKTLAHLDALHQTDQKIRELRNRGLTDE